MYVKLNEAVDRTGLQNLQEEIGQVCKIYKMRCINRQDKFVKFTRGDVLTDKTSL